MAKTINKKEAKINLHKKNSSFLEMKKFVNSRTPKMNYHSNTLSKV